MAEFRDLLHQDGVLTFLAAEGLSTPQAVQSATIPLLVKGHSVSILAPTGSGKTLAYALPIAQALKVTEAEQAGPQPRGAPRAWVLVPTAELMEQVLGVFRALSHQVKLRVRADRPGERGRKTQATLSSPVDVLVTSPARALRALDSGRLRPDHARFLICDEADQLFDADFSPQVGAVFAKLRSPDLQVGLFSATMPDAFAARRKTLFEKVQFENVVVQGSHCLRDNIATSNHTLQLRDKQAFAQSLWARQSAPGFIFVNQKTTARTLFHVMREKAGAKHVGLLHGGMPKAERRAALAQFVSSGGLLICTDVAARGLDLPNVEWVLNYDMPFEPTYYVHRCGRAGRRGNPAAVHNLVTSEDRSLIARVNVAIRQQSALKLSEVVASPAKSQREGSSPGRPRKSRKQAAPKPRVRAKAGKREAKTPTRSTGKPRRGAGATPGQKVASGRGAPKANTKARPARGASARATAAAKKASGVPRRRRGPKS